MVFLLISTHNVYLTSNFKVVALVEGRHLIEKCPFQSNNSYTFEILKTLYFLFVNKNKQLLLQYLVLYIPQLQLIFIGTFFVACSTCI